MKGDFGIGYNTDDICIWSIVAVVLLTIQLLYILLYYIRKKGMLRIREQVYDLLISAEKLYRNSENGTEKLDYVLHMARTLLPPFLQIMISKAILKKMIQFWYGGLKDYLDDGTLNQSEDKTNKIE